MASKKTPYQLLVIALKLLIFSLAIVFIYLEVFQNKDTNKLRTQLVEAFVTWPQSLWLLLVVVLMLVNWSIEAVKWKALLKNMVTIPYRKAFAATLSGTTISLITPNKMGGFLGRIIYLNPNQRVAATFSSFYGNYSQLLVTVLLGITSLFYAIGTNHSFKEFGTIHLWWLTACLVPVLIIMLYFYFNVAKLSRVVRKFPFLKKYTDKTAVWEAYRQSEQWNFLWLSAARYFVFTMQFYLLLIVFGVELEVLQGMMLVALIYLVITIIPTSVLGKLGVRESIALMVIGAISSNQNGILLASFLLWVINLVVPAIIGSLLILRAKIQLSSRK